MSVHFLQHHLFRLSFPPIKLILHLVKNQLCTFVWACLQVFYAIILEVIIAMLEFDSAILLFVFYLLALILAPLRSFSCLLGSYRNTF